VTLYGPRPATAVCRPPRLVAGRSAPQNRGWSSSSPKATTEHVAPINLLVRFSIWELDVPCGGTFLAPLRWYLSVLCWGIGPLSAMCLQCSDHFSAQRWRPCRPAIWRMSRKACSTSVESRSRCLKMQTKQVQCWDAGDKPATFWQQRETSNKIYIMIFIFYQQ